MEIVNLKTFETARKAYIKFETEGVYFSSMAAEMLGLFPDLRVNFVTDKDDWMFYCGDDVNGFPLKERIGERSMRINSAALSKMFAAQTRCSLPCKFKLTELKARLNNIPLIKIEINKPLEK